MALKVLMHPHPEQLSGEGGVKRVLQAYHKHLPDYGIHLIKPGQPFDLVVVHAGMTTEMFGNVPLISALHGLYWTEDYEASRWEWEANAAVIQSIRRADKITVPSNWVAETIKRDLRLSPAVIPHGIDWQEWQVNGVGDYVLWNKNRTSDVCDPLAVNWLGSRFPKVKFLTTFARDDKPLTQNVKVSGLLPHAAMKQAVEGCGVYLSTVKETFGIGVLEAMAAGKPVLGWKQGGNLDLVQHGVTGYLAEVGNYKDLEAGLDYCLKYAAVLGGNAREAVKAFGWNTACALLVDVFRDAVEPQPPTVGVVIPVYNKPVEQVRQAVDSALNQTLKPDKIIMVNDGSDDKYDLPSLILQYQEGKPEVLYLYNKTNQGVAHARNNGIAKLGAKYICCLDADDQIEAEFLRLCVEALEADPLLGIAYTGLGVVNEDGQVSVSEWPPDNPNYDKQCDYKARQNQIPTCCVFRREVWERTGGYRQRYAPRGAGSEDAAFWTLFGALGYKAKKVTTEPLFKYRLGGNVSSDPEYKEADWLAFYPWSVDKRHPFASIATPKNGISHGVRQYDEPVISVVVPCGPGHSHHLPDLLDSLEAQSFRNWEAIIVFDGEEQPVNLLTVYPYVRTTTLEGLGAGAARNAGAAMARGRFLLFLDADDTLNANVPDGLRLMVEKWRETGNAVYSDFIGRAYVESLDELDAKIRNAIIHQDKDGEIFYKSQLKPYRCDYAILEPQGERAPYVWNLITTLVPIEWHRAAGGFDETMLSLEDWEYWLRLAKMGYCFSKVDKPLVIYKYYTGTRRDFLNNGQNQQSLLKYISEKHRSLEIMGCNCGGKSTNGAVTAMADDNFVLCTYLHPNTGQHFVVGASIHPAPIQGYDHAYVGQGQYKIKYGRHSGGGREKFAVHKDDIRLQPHYFRPVEDVLPPREPEPVTEPVAMAEPVSERAVREPVKVGLETKPLGKSFDLQLLPGVTRVIVPRMKAAGLTSKEAIIAAGLEGLTDVRGIGEAKAEMILEYLKD